MLVPLRAKTSKQTPCEGVASLDVPLWKTLMYTQETMTPHANSYHVLQNAMQKRRIVHSRSWPKKKSIATTRPDRLINIYIYMN